MHINLGIVQGLLLVASDIARLWVATNGRVDTDDGKKGFVGRSGDTAGPTTLECRVTCGAGAGVVT